MKKRRREVHEGKTWQADDEKDKVNKSTPLELQNDM